MTNTNIMQKLEIVFWNRAIQLMTDSQFVQKWVREAYEIYLEPSKATWIPLTVFASASIGLGMGYLIGAIRLLVR